MPCVILHRALPFNQLIDRRLSASRLFQSAGAEESRRIGIGTPELVEKHHRLLGTAALQEGLAEGLRGGGIEDAVRFELLPGIHIQDFGPQITVVTGTVAAVEDVVEIGCPV